MTQDGLPRDEMHYDALTQEALRGVVKSALKRAASPQGLPGDHHFYITFKTQTLGVSVPGELLARYPDEMTIVLQHQYWDLIVTDSHFAVTLKFGGQSKRVQAPFGSVVRFYDPSVQFLLQFEPPHHGPFDQDDPDGDDDGDDLPPKPSGDDGPKVVALDQFRKK